MQQLEKAHKDKLAETKAREMDIKKAHRQELQAKKAEKAEETLKYKATLRDLRAHSHSKRAEREKRQALKKEIRRENDPGECAHGIHRCKICFPHGPHHDHKGAQNVAVH